MTPGKRRRISGLLTGAALIGIGSFEAWISRSDFESQKMQSFCGVGLCAEQFAPERVFEMSQKSALGDARGELEYFKRGLRLSPASAYRWADLAEAEFNTRDFTQAEYALQHAVEAGPRSPVILMRAANVEFEMGDNERMMKDLAAILRDPTQGAFYDSVFFTLSRSGQPLDEFLKRTIPQTKSVVSSLLTFWTRAGRVNEALETWNWANARGLANARSTGDFFYFLMSAKRQDEAQNLWQQYAEKREPQYRKSNWIYNPDFATNPTPSPFDWSINPREDVEVERVASGPASNDWSMQYRFHGDANTDYQQTSQDMVLPPGRYRFSGSMKTEQITSDEGMRFHILDQPTQAGLNVWTDTLTGTKDRTTIEAAFEVRPEVKVVRIVIDRKPSMAFDNKIGGTVWISNLKLSRQ